MTRGLAVVALVVALWLTTGTTRALPRPELSRLMYSADLGCQYACIWLEDRVQTNIWGRSSYLTTNDFHRLAIAFRTAVTNNAYFPDDIVLVAYSITEGLVFYTNGFRSGSSGLPYDLFPDMPVRVQPLYVSTVVRLSNDTNVCVGMTHTVYVCSYSLGNYGVFADGDLTLRTDRNMEITGPVHCNRNLRLGMYGGQTLGLRNYVTCSSNIYVTEGATKIYINVAGDLTDHNMTTAAGGVLDCSNLFWKTLALSTWQGRVKSAVHGISVLKVPIPYVGNEPRILIEPQTNINENINVANMRYYNRAAVRIIDDQVQKYDGSNNFITIGRLGEAGISSGGTAWLFTNAFFYSLGISNYVCPLDIDVGKFVTWANANAADAFCNNSQRAGLVYVYSSSNRPVRLRNAGILPASVVNGIANGFMFVTGNALYTWGNVNWWPTDPALAVPAVCMADSITALSADWTDAAHDDPGDGVGMVSADCHLWTSMFTGFATNHDVVAGTTFYGGIECLPKYIEGWVGAGVTNKMDVRGSIISLWASHCDTFNYVDSSTSPSSVWTYDPCIGGSSFLPAFCEIRPIMSTCVTNW